MLELPHVMVGAAIASLTSQPLLALPLALASHFVTDYVPHWNPHLSTELKKYGRYTTQSLAIVIIDATLALVVGLVLSARLLPDVNYFLLSLACCFLAVAPDVVEIPHFFFKTKIGWIEKLCDYQKNHQWNVPIVWGVLAQLVVMGLCLYLTLSA